MGRSGEEVEKKWRRRRETGETGREGERRGEKRREEECPGC
jgi:hypothetical protein